MRVSCIVQAEQVQSGGDSILTLLELLIVFREGLELGLDLCHLGLAAKCAGC